MARGSAMTLRLAASKSSNKILPSKGRFELGRVEQVKDDDVVAFETKLAQSFEDRFRFVEQIGDQDDQAAALDLSGDAFQEFSRRWFRRPGRGFPTHGEFAASSRAWRAAARRIRPGRKMSRRRRHLAV